MGIIGTIGPSIAVYLYLIKKRQQTAVMALTTKFLLARNTGNLDELLGVLIGGKEEWSKVDPTEEFFNALQDVCGGADYEIKRRLAEALPALFSMDSEKTETIVTALRRDWDEKKKGDNRRRAVEALTVMIDYDRQFLLETLEVHADDEIFTIIAIAEVLHDLRTRWATIADAQFIDLLLHHVQVHYGNVEVEALKILWELLNLINTDREAALQRVDMLIDSANPFVQICVARNLRRLCRGYPVCLRKGVCKGRPERILAFIRRLLDKTENKNARRPVAKEDSLDCLIALLPTRFRQDASEIILRLLDDSDKIIRVTAFDKIHKVSRRDKEFASVIVRRVLEKNVDPELIDRVKRLRVSSGIV